MGLVDGGKMNRAYVGGTFDVLHAGHINLINKVIMLGFEPIIVVNSDSFVESYRGKKPLFNEYERENTINELYPDIDTYVVDEDDQMSLIDSIRPSVIVVGTDWMKPEILPQLGINEDVLREFKISMLFIPRFNSINTTLIKERIKNA